MNDLNSIEKAFFVKDFIVVYSRLNQPPTFEGYTSYHIDINTIIYYNKSDSISNWQVTTLNSKTEIINLNPFFPFFTFKSSNLILTSPNYSHISNTVQNLTTNLNGIREFVLYNIPLGNKTFHNEVNREYNVSKIIIGNNILQFEKTERVDSENPIQDIIQNRIKDYMGQLQKSNSGILLSGGSESRINAAASISFSASKDFITWGHPENIEFIIAKKIARKFNSNHFNIRPNSLNLPYEELLQKSGYIVNMQYAYRYEVIKKLFSESKYDAIWTGWGDINGYPNTDIASELFTNYYLGLYKGEYRYPLGWSQSWLKEYNQNDDFIKESIHKNACNSTFFSIKRELLAPAIFGQVLSLENTLGSVISPWFHPDIYKAVAHDESKNQKLVNNKPERTLWKNEIYYQLLKNYCPSLNHIITSKGYYHFLVRNRYGYPGLMVAGFMKKFATKRDYPFDPVENKEFMIYKLREILKEGHEIFSRKDIKTIIEHNKNWSGPQILEYFKLIQIDMFLKQ